MSKSDPNRVKHLANKGGVDDYGNSYTIRKGKIVYAKEAPTAIKKTKNREVRTGYIEGNRATVITPTHKTKVKDFGEHTKQKSKHSKDSALKAITARRREKALLGSKMQKRSPQVVRNIVAKQGDKKFRSNEAAKRREEHRQKLLNSPATKKKAEATAQKYRKEIRDQRVRRKKADRAGRRSYISARQGVRKLVRGTKKHKGLIGAGLAVGSLGVAATEYATRNHDNSIIGKIKRF
jgi:hypothetical protein